MGQSKSKLREKKVEEQKKSSSFVLAKAKEKPVEKEVKQPDKESLSQPPDSSHFVASKHSKPSSSSSEDRPDIKQKSIKKKNVIPQIIITHASNETLISYGVPDSEEQRTIREHADWGPYYRHRNPSTIIAYNVHNTE
ncbi:spermatogenesis-associated protein 33 [Meriones unguiculatus]|uniref:spermatogenesis-associated protein 33 n=1 Tax=Meriones unguiculatus TaxID=10047 RepID=UPI000B4EE128|nr:spermatogenesis-associated protein 33 [Meriones unguiculatus]